MAAVQAATFCMHHIYHTKAIVLASWNVGEANKRLTLFTRDMGMLTATVQGIRHGKSKLRFALQDFSLAHVDLVRGRDVWRVTSARPIESFATRALSKDTGTLIKHSAELLLRLYRGEDPHPELFDEVLGLIYGFDALEISPQDLKHFEIIAILRILFHLGYYAPTTQTQTFLTHPLTTDLIAQATMSRAVLLQEVQKSLEVSQL